MPAPVTGSLSTRLPDNTSIKPVLVIPDRPEITDAPLLSITPALLSVLAPVKTFWPFKDQIADDSLVKVAL